MATKKDLDAAIAKMTQAIADEANQITTAVQGFQQKLAEAQAKLKDSDGELDLSAEVAQINLAVANIRALAPASSDALDPTAPSGVSTSIPNDAPPPPAPVTPTATVPAGILVDDDGLPLDQEGDVDLSTPDSGDPGTGRDTVGTDPSSGGTTATGKGDVANV